ncbi:MAG: 3-isopropylmalate dehydratase large subunit [Firmicutes bacterium]|nr:3-isopropylmalate dehydratase large subunit [Dethiobacter sp.]MBS3897388.1 3-isopropylmalate dehydratase large subunit [Dethiobacter sp.]MCL4463123.1 3-isopropylmalate dehydratase large subunit [Bacillota bacterium]MCL5994237.1 3-isopropylmalate dehydratase large subunit [Bacillota bacterium]
MGMTIAEKILAQHAGKDVVRPGELITARVDMVLGNDITSPLAINEFKKIGVNRVFDKDRIALVPDHFTPNKDIKSAEQSKLLREFAREHQITYYYEVGRMGIEHALLPEEGLALPGEIIIGADSHTCTYGALGAMSTGVGSTDMAAAMALGEAWFKVPSTLKFVFNGKLQPWVSGKDLVLYLIGKIGVDGALYRSMEFWGEMISSLSMDSRLAMCNMAIEAGAKCGIIEPDQITLDYVTPRAKRNFTPVYVDKDAEYEKVYTFSGDEIEPQVAFPHLPENTRGISEVGEVRLDQVVIGSCTNGRMEDLRIAAEILRGKKVHRDVRLLIIPGTQNIVRQAMREGLLEIFIAAEAVVSTPTCGPCLGGHMGILANGERALATTNRNFVGRMGHPGSEVYLSNPAIAAASAIAGKICAPGEVL